MCVGVWRQDGMEIQGIGRKSLETKMFLFFFKLTQDFEGDSVVDLGTDAVGGLASDDCPV